MARKCSITKKSRQHGHRVSHAKNRSKHVFKANIQVKRIWLPELSQFVKVKLSTKALRTVDKLGLKATLKKYNLKLNEVLA